MSEQLTQVKDTKVWAELTFLEKLRGAPALLFSLAMIFGLISLAITVVAIAVGPWTFDGFFDHFIEVSKAVCCVAIFGGVVAAAKR